MNYFPVKPFYDLISDQKNDDVFPVYDASFSLTGFAIGDDNFLHAKEAYSLISSHVSQQTKNVVQEVKPAFDASGSFAGFIIIASGPVSAVSSIKIPEIGNGIDLSQILTTVEKTVITEAMNKANGVIAEAARLLNMNRTTLHERMRRLDIL